MWLKMEKKILALILIIVLAVPLTAAAQNSNQPADSNVKSKTEAKIVARVNGEKITNQQLAQETNLNQLLMGINRISPQFVQTLTNTESGQKVLAKYKEQQLESLINNLLLQQQVEQKGISLTQKEKNEIYQKQKKAILERNNLNQEKFLSILKKQGFKTEKEYKQKFVKNPQLKINKLVEKEVVSNLEVSEAEIKQTYQENKEQFTKNGKTQPLEKVKPQIKEMLKQQKRNKKISQYVENLREKAEIEKNI
jgi:hypothetical protein